MHLRVVGVVPLNKKRRSGIAATPPRSV